MWLLVTVFFTYILDSDVESMIKWLDTEIRQSHVFSNRVSGELSADGNITRWCFAGAVSHISSHFQIFALLFQSVLLRVQRHFVWQVLFNEVLYCTFT